MTALILAILLCLISVTDSLALEVIDLIEGKTEFVEVSGRDLNAIVFPVDVDVFTRSDVLDIKVQERRIFVSFKQDEESGQSVEAPEQIYILTEDNTYTIVLVPRSIPAETVIAKVKGIADKDEVIKWEKEHPYISTMKSLIKAMYIGVPPSGYEMVKTDVDKYTSMWEGISQILGYKYVGVTLVGEKFILTNNTADTIRLQESEFYHDGVVAVSIDSHEILPGQTTDLYMVKKN